MTDEEFPTLTEAHVVSEGPVQYDVLVEYAREVGIQPTTEGRVRWQDRTDIEQPGPPHTATEEE